MWDIVEREKYRVSHASHQQHGECRNERAENYNANFVHEMCFDCEAVMSSRVCRWADCWGLSRRTRFRLFKGLSLDISL